MILNSAGRMIKDQWLSIANENIKIHNYCIMPNHFHAIIEFTRDIEHKNIKNNGAPTRDAPTLGNVIGSFKSLTTNNYIEMVKRNILPPFEKRIWQKNYYELIIKSYKAYIKISEYIKNNPLKWKEDRYYL
jgi:REP element-mobilizing transposase RayT